MKILVIGNSRETAGICAGMRFAGDNRQPAGGLVHYRDTAQALRELERGVHQYGWVLIESGSTAQATAEAVRARSGPVPVALFDNFAVANGATETVPALCAVETTCDGLQILRCALHRASREPGGQHALHEAIDNQPLVFEYHAPCSKTR